MSVIPPDEQTEAALHIALDISHASTTPESILQRSKFGSIEIERLVCEPNPLGLVDTLQPRQSDAWARSFPGLDTLPDTGGKARPIKFCIATEEIVGPVRNGGIGTTYAYLAEVLANTGLDVTILYLRGNDVENGTIDQWIDWYGAKGVKFVPVPNYAVIDRLQTGADRWLQAPYNMMRYLLLHPMDVVHVSEWRGSAYLSLLAKRQGLAFDHTLFLVKTSSPWLWNRLYGSHPLERAEDLTKIFAERQSVELADVVIGGSAHLLRWMASQGYRLPDTRTFVQPNVVSFAHLKDLERSGDRKAGERMAINEIVFFGRLESRKGLLTFCEAIKRLIRRGKPLPPRISFMGKAGARLTSRPDQDILDYIKGETATWPCEVEIHTEFQQMDALRYLLADARLAVMPSVIENSSLAVYEAAICNIPFIASDSGGTPELVHEADRALVLCSAHPISLAEKIEEAVTLGGYVARPSFDNDQNIVEWNDFHLKLGTGLIDTLLLASRPSSVPNAHIDVAVCIYHSGTLAQLKATLASLQEQASPPEAVIVGLDADVGDTGLLTKEFALPLLFIDCSDFDAGLAFNAMASRASNEFCLFMWSGATLIPQALGALRTTASSSGADVVNFFHRVVTSNDIGDTGHLNAFIIGSVSESFFRSQLSSIPLFVRRRSFDQADGFTTDYRVLCCEHEFVARCQVLGLKCTTALMEMGAVPAFEEAWLRERCYDVPVSHFRAIRPQIAAAPLALRDLLLLAKGYQTKPPAKGGGAKKVKVPPQSAPGKSAKNTGFTKLFESITGERWAFEPDRKPPAAAKPAEVAEEKPAAVAKDRKESFAVMQLRDRLSSVGGQSDTYRGAVLGVRGRTIHGWIRNQMAPDVPVMLDVRVDRRPSRPVRADAKLESAFYLPRDLEGHAFTFEVPPPNPMRRSLGGPQRVAIDIHGSDVTLATLDVGFRTMKQAGYDGFCELLTTGAISGWAWKPTEPDKTVEVALFVDGRFLVRVPCVKEREDVRQAGHGHGHYGFQVFLPKTLRNGVERRIEVVVGDCGVLLKNGRLLLRGDELTHV